jgi:acetylornithine deacetylase/succinyl-diaminopimelate desuccinylase-like protein
MAARLRTAGFSGDDVQVFKPAQRKGNPVVRLRGAGARKPIPLLAHLDVVEALPIDWSFDLFKLTEKDGYYYGRGTGDDKYTVSTPNRFPIAHAPRTIRLMFQPPCR